MKIGLQTWGSDGDIRPFLSLSGGLSSAGHEVTLVITSVDNKKYTEYGKAMNFAILHVGEFLYEEKEKLIFSKQLVKLKNPLKQLEAILKSYFNPMIPEMFDAAQRLSKENDVLIGHSLLYPLQIATELDGKPYITLTFNHGAVFSKLTPIFGVPNFGKWMNPFWEKLIKHMFDGVLSVEVNKLRNKVHLPAVKNILETILTSHRLNLLAVSNVICQRQLDWPEYQKVCGYLNVSEKAEEWIMPEKLRFFIESGPPPVYITLGSIFSFDTAPQAVTQMLVQAALLAGCRAIVQSKWDEIQDIEDHVSIYKIQKAPHQYIFPFCCAVVHHGGSGTTHSATLAGCPSVIIEHIVDQSLFAYELNRIGIAPHVLHRRNVSVKKLANAIKIVRASTEMKKRAEALSLLMKKEDGVKTAVRLIEKSLGSDINNN